jgi:hypothetical protein
MSNAVIDICLENGKHFHPFLIGEVRTVFEKTSDADVASWRFERHGKIDLKFSGREEETNI